MKLPSNRTVVLSAHRKGVYNVTKRRTIKALDEGIGVPQYPGKPRLRERSLNSISLGFRRTTLMF